MKPAFSIPERIETKLAETFGLDPETKKFLGGFHNVVYELEGASGPRVLRISETEHRTRQELFAEIEWVNYLADHNMPLTRMLRSEDGNFVASESSFNAVLLAKADGEFLTPEMMLETPEQLGRILGQMHRLSEGFRPKSPRFRWNKSSFITDPTSDDLYAHQTRFQALCSKLESLPETESTFGMTHNDIHRGNFVRNGQEVTIFDTDDCCLQYYLSDVAMVFLYALAFSDFDRDTRRNYVRRFWNAYLEERTPNDDIAIAIPDFMERRVLVLHALLLPRIENMNEAQKRFYDRVNGFVLNPERLQEYVPTWNA